MSARTESGVGGEIGIYLLGWGEDFRDWSGGYAGRFRTVYLYAEMGLIR